VDIRKFFIAAAVAVAAMPATAAPVPATTNANGHALILVPLTLTKIDDLDFGTVISSATSGMIAINASSGARTLAGGVIGSPTDIGHRAYFGGAGSPSQQVLVTLTAPTDLVNSNGDKIQVLALTQDGSPLRTINPVTRAFFVGVGGIILIDVNQPDGDYNATFTVTASYQ
jgi:opacity protein-like surface antigen